MDYVKIDDLRPCDVLLGLGSGTLSHLICLFDKSNHSHSVVYLGETTEGRKIAHATLKGVIEDSLESLKCMNFVNVYRFKKDGEFMGEKGWPFQPVKKTAEEFTKNGIKYATDHLILLAFLVLTRHFPLSKKKKWYLRGILDRAAELIAKLKDDHTKAMVCSELVYRSFNIQVDDKDYTIEIINQENIQNFSELFLRPTPTADTDILDIELDDNHMEEYFDDNNIEEQFELSKEKFLDVLLKAHDIDIPASKITIQQMQPIIATWVTPGDLEKSPSLVKLGRLLWK